MFNKDIEIKQELLGFANWFEKNITDEQFDFNEVVSEWDAHEAYDDNGKHPCGVVCCAAGWMPTYHAKKSGRSDEMYWLLPSNKRVAEFLYKGQYMTFIELMSGYFSIPEEHVRELFIPFNEQDTSLRINKFFERETSYVSWHHEKGEVWIADGMPMATADATVADVVFMLREYVKRYDSLNDLTTPKTPII